MTESELVAEIEGELRGDDTATDADRPYAEATEDFGASIERHESTTTEAQLIAEINGDTA